MSITADAIIRTFNRVNGTQFRIGSWQEKIEELGDKYGMEYLYNMARTITANSPADIFNAPFIETRKALAEALNVVEKQVTGKNPQVEELKKETEKLRAELDKSRQLKIEEEKSTLSLGLVEKALARVMVEEYAPTLAESLYNEAKAKIEQEYGKIVKTIEYHIPQTNGIITETTHEEFETVLSFVMVNEPVMLVGSAGTGKNVICKQIAKAMNLEFYFSNAVTQEYKLTGFIDANGNFHETEFYKAFKNGGLFMLDEIDASIPEVLVILNAAIANRYFDFPNGKIEAHENFRVIAAGNTYGLGASYQYVGRNQLDAASLDRFAQVEIEYSPHIEASLTQDTELLNFIRKFRKACVDNGINHVVSYRTITRLDKISHVMPVEKALRTCLLKNMEVDDMNMMVRRFDGDSKWERGFVKCVEQR